MGVGVGVGVGGIETVGSGGRVPVGNGTFVFRQKAVAATFVTVQVIAPVAPPAFGVADSQKPVEDTTQDVVKPPAHVFVPEDPGGPNTTSREPPGSHVVPAHPAPPPRDVHPEAASADCRDPTRTEASSSPTTARVLAVPPLTGASLTPHHPRVSP